MNLRKKNNSEFHPMICKHEAAWKALLVVLATKSEWSIKQIFSEITLIELQFETGTIGDMINATSREETEAALRRLKERESVQTQNQK